LVLPASTLALVALVGTVASAAKDVFIRSKPHVNVIVVGGVQLEAMIHVEAGLLGDGTAVGTVQVRTFEGPTFVYRAIGGAAIVDGDDVTGLTLIVERVGSGRRARGETDIITIRQSTTVEDCLIYDFVGPDVHFESPGELVLRDPIPR
jgi:hypothetical protein